MGSNRYGSRRRTLPDDEIVRLYVEGLDSDTVGARANCSCGTVLDLVRAAGQQVRRPGGRPHNLKVSEDEVCRRYLAGDSGPAIASAIGCTPSAIYHVLKRRGVERRADSARTAMLAASTARRHKKPQ
jgi:DNA-binding CsgD family transcriptional regulator